MKFIVGDIHGEYLKLKSIVEFILSYDQHPEFIFIGDYIDKGSNSLEVLNFLTSLSKQYSCSFIMGNHEYHWIKSAEKDIQSTNYLQKYGGQATCLSFGIKDIFETARDMLSNYSTLFQSMVAFIDLDNYFICHEGMMPFEMADFKNIPLEGWFNKNRYQILSTNFEHKKMLIFGHTAFYYPYYFENKLDIDTGACYLSEQPLTAFCIEEKMFYNSLHKKLTLDQHTTNYLPVIIRTKP